MSKQTERETTVGVALTEDELSLFAGGTTDPIKSIKGQGPD